MDNNPHPLHEWEEQADIAQAAFNKQALLDTALVYSVFSTEGGKMLLDRWKEVLIYSPTAKAGEDQISIGINEGYKSFIRIILNAIKTHEDQQ